MVKISVLLSTCATRDTLLSDEIITIQAESFEGMSGVSREITTDEGGGENVGSIQTCDWMYYPAVTIPTTGTYRVSYCVASENGGGALQFENASGSRVYGTLSMPATGDYQTWTTISYIVTLSSGLKIFGILATGGDCGLSLFERGKYFDCDWTMNWFTITKV